jgi:hypothetical protein
MNLATITSIMRHWITPALAALALWLVAPLALSADEAKQLTTALSQLAEPLVAVLALVAVAGARLLIKAIGKFIGWGAGEIGDRYSGIPALAAMIGTAVVIGGSLPSCSSAQIETARAFPVHLGIRTDYGDVGYSSKSGVSYYIDRRSSYVDRRSRK